MPPLSIDGRPEAVPQGTESFALLGPSLLDPHSHESKPIQLPPWPILKLQSIDSIAAPISQLPVTEKPCYHDLFLKLPMSIPWSFNVPRPRLSSACMSVPRQPIFLGPFPFQLPSR